MSNSKQLFFIFFLWQSSFAQLTVSSNQTASVLVNKLLGSGVTSSNATINCPGISNGSFTAVGTNLGMTSGIILSTGFASSNVASGDTGINGNWFWVANRNNGSFASDPDLSTLSTAVQKNMCKLEFDFVPKGDTVYFQYVFGSEEYPGYICTQFNDVFGFFISGPGITGNKNIALVPGTSIPVAINSINDSSATGPFCTGMGAGSPFKKYYVSNNQNYTVFNGFTKLMSAKSAVSPYQTYHIKMAISDIIDTGYDSGVFIKEASFASVPLLEIEPFSTGSIKTNPLYIIEGCGAGVIKVKKPAGATPVTVNLSYSGSALFGIDYTAPATSITIPASDTLYSINVNALSDALTELGDSVKIVLTSSSINFKDSVTFKIYDFGSGVSVYNSTNDTNICYGSQVPLRASVSSPAYSISWNPTTYLINPTTLTPTVVYNGPNVFTMLTYNARLSIVGCSPKDTPINIFVQPIPQLNAGNDTTICKGDSISLNASVLPSGVYSTIWNANPTLSSTNILNPKSKATTNQTYILTASTSFGCTSKDTINVSVSNIISEIQSVIPNPPGCGSVNGTITINMNGISAPYLYSINNGTLGTNNVFSGLNPGAYPIKIVNKFGCQKDTIVVVPNGVTPPTVNNVKTNTKCGLNNGSILTSVTGGKPPYTFLWSRGDITANISNVAAGNYTLSVSDSNNCVIIKSFTIVGSTAMNDTLTKNNEKCSLSNGSVNLMVTGGASPIQYLWNTGETSTSLNNKPAGKYKVTITDNDNCIRVDSIFITNSPPPSILLSSQSAMCSQSNGSVSAIVTGSASPFVYQWSNGTNTNNLSSVTGGSYMLTITDTNLCSVSASITVGNKAAPIITSSVVNTNCGNSLGAINLTVSGGTNPISYSWSQGAVTKNISNLTAGNYTVTATDSNNCIVIQTISVINNSNPALSFTKKDITCSQNNGSINLIVTNAGNPVTYLWSNGKDSSFIKNLSPGTYVVTVTDGFNCIKIDSVTIVDKPKPNLNIVSTNTSCGLNNGAININVVSASKPVKFIWNNGDTTKNRSNLPGGQYIVLTTDTNQCTRKDTIVIAPSTSPSANFIKIDAICKDTLGSITLATSGGIAPYTYLWSNGATSSSLLNTSPGAYSVTVKDANNCTTSLSTSILRMPPPIFLDSVKNPICDNGKGSIELYNIVGTFPMSYLWSNDPTIVIPKNTLLQKGSYTVTINDANGCTVIKQYDLVDSGLVVIDSFVKNHKCDTSNGFINLTLKKGYPPFTFQWSNGATTQNISGLGTGDYYLTVTDAKGCVKYGYYNIKNSTNMVLEFKKDSTKCDSNTGKILVSVKANTGTAPFKYKWSTQAQDTTALIKNLSPKLYTVTVTDSNKCTIEGDALIEYISTPQITDSFVNTKCGLINGKIFLTIGNAPKPISIYWNNVKDSVYNKTNLPAGYYALKVVDSAGCTNTIYREVLATMTAKLTFAKLDPACGTNNGFITTSLDSPGVYTYLWNTGQTSANLNNLGPGNYKVNIVDKNGCLISDSIVLAYTSKPVVVMSKVDATCGLANGIATANSSPTYSYVWSNGVNNANSLVGVFAGKYKVTVTDSRGCATVDSIMVPNIPKPQIIKIKTDALCFENIGAVSMNFVGTAPFVYSWSNFSTSLNQSNLHSGRYILTVTDANNCITIDTTDIIFYPKPSLTIVNTLASCSQANGTAITNVTYGTAPLSYSWSNGATSANLINQFGGLYKVTVTDVKGCKDSGVTTIPSTFAPVISLTKSNASCSLSNGSASATFSGGVAPFIYNWNNTFNTLSISNKDSGKYVFSVLDSNNCLVKDSVHIDRIESPVPIVTKTNDRCTQKIGQITLNIVQGKPPYTYTWSNTPVNSNSISGLGSGNYTVTITDSINCSVTQSIIINDSASPKITLTKTKATCGYNNGSINATTILGNPPFQYFWNGVSGTATKSFINGGKFVLQIVDNIGCISKDSLWMDTVKPLTIQYIKTEANCALNNGKIKAIVSGGDSTYSYAWSNGINTDTVVNLNNGMYKITVTDGKGCVLVDSTPLLRSATPSVTFGITQSTCGNNNGSIISNVSGTAPLSYLWSRGDVTKDILNLSSGSYFITITDKYSCKATYGASFISKGISDINFSVNQPVCESNNGSVVASAVNNVGPVTYLWNNGSTSSTRTNLAPGTYTLTITDSLGCTFSKSITLLNQKSPSITLNKTNANCNLNNGTINVSVVDGQSPFLYVWSNGANTPSVDNLDTGLFTLIVSDLNGCKDTASIHINRTKMLQTSMTAKNSSCGLANGKASVIASFGTSPYIYSWSNGVFDTVINNVLSNVYNVTVVDDDQCVVVNSINVPNTEGPTVSYTTINSACGNSNGKITVSSTTGTPPFTYLWSTGATSNMIQNLPQGIYSVTITDKNGCTDQTMIQIVNVIATINAKHKPRTCNIDNGWIKISVNRGNEPYTYSWSNGATSDSISNLSANIYTVTVYDARGCVLTLLDTIINVLPPVISFNKIDPYCLKANGSISSVIVNGTPPFQYLWSNGSVASNITNLLQGPYRLTLIDSWSCIRTYTDTLKDQPNDLQFNYTKNNLICYKDFSGNITLNATGTYTPFNYYLNAAPNSPISSNVFSALSAGKYVLKVIDDRGCIKTDTTMLTQPDSFYVNNPIHKDLLCFQENIGELKVDAGGGVPPYKYLWDNGVKSQTINSLPAGTYSIKVFDANNCVIDKSYTITEPSNLKDSSKVDNPSCHGDKNGQIFNVFSGGVPPYIYTWSNGTSLPSQINLPYGKYILVVKDKNQCIDTFKYNLIDPPLVVIDSISKAEINCIENKGGIIQIFASGGNGTPYEYSIDNGQKYQFLNIFKSLNKGSYNIIVKDSKGCFVTSVTKINETAHLEVKAFPRDTTIDVGESVQLGFRVTNGDSLLINRIEWNPFTSLNCNYCEKPIATPYNTKTYYLNIAYANKCNALDTIRVKVKSTDPIFVPNAFSPNGDGTNDILKVYGNHIKAANLAIYNKIGEKVFESNSAHLDGWDGTYKGELCIPDVFSYYAEVYMLDNKVHILKGSITLVR